MSASVTAHKAHGVHASPASPKLHSVDASLHLLGNISQSLAYKLMKEGRIKFVKIGSRRLIPDSEIERIAREGIAPAAS